jgi:hypothetical protein
MGSSHTDHEPSSRGHDQAMKEPMVMMAVDHYGHYSWVQVPIVALALWLFPTLGSEGKFTPFALFLGAAMSITAFPVLARILTDRGLYKTRIGTVALTVGAVDDVVVTGIRRTGSPRVVDGNELAFCQHHPENRLEAPPSCRRELAGEDVGVLEGQGGRDARREKLRQPRLDDHATCTASLCQPLKDDIGVDDRSPAPHQASL